MILKKLPFYFISVFSLALLFFILMQLQNIYANDEAEETFCVKFYASENGSLSFDDERGMDSFFTEEIPKTSKWKDKVNLPHAIPDEGYMFIGWSSADSNDIVTGFPDEVEKNYSYTAVFAKLQSENTDSSKVNEKKTSLLYKLYLFCVGR